MKKNQKDIYAALDIGGYSVKAAAISNAKDKPVLVKYSIKPVGDNIIKAISQAHSELGVSGTKVIASISGPTVIARYIDMPSMSKDELSDAIRFEAEKVMPYDIKDIQLDAVKTEDLEGNRMRVVMVAAKKDLIQSQMKILSEAGFEPVIFDVDSFALANSFINTGIDNTDVCGLLNIGYNKSSLNIVKDGKTYLSRDIDIAGKGVVKLIADNLSISDAEALKMLEEKLARFEELSGEEKESIKEPVAEVLSRLADESVLSFDFYENQHGNNVSKVYISGGMAIPRVTEDLLKENLGRDTQRWNPMTNIELSTDIDSKVARETAPQLAVVTGLALRKP